MKGEFIMNKQEAINYISKELTREGIDLRKAVESSGEIKTYVKKICDIVENKLLILK